MEIYCTWVFCVVFTKTTVGFRQQHSQDLTWLGRNRIWVLGVLFERSFQSLVLKIQQISNTQVF